MTGTRTYRVHLLSPLSDPGRVSVRSGRVRAETSERAVKLLLPPQRGQAVLALATADCSPGTSGWTVWVRRHGQLRRLEGRHEFDAGAFRLKAPGYLLDAAGLRRTEDEERESWQEDPDAWKRG